MNARQRRVVAVAAVTVIAVSLAAATIDSIVGPPGVGDATTPPSRPDAVPPVEPDAPPCVRWLATPGVLLGLLGGLGGCTLVVRRRFSRFAAAAFVAGLCVPVLALYFHLTHCAGEAARLSAGGRPRLPAVPSGGFGLPVPSFPAVTYGPLILGGLVLAAVMLAVSLYYRRRDHPVSVAARPVGSAGTAAASAAGDAAARIEAGGDLETEIHRAWRDMATHLNVARPTSSTPGEFASAALAAGLPEDAVRELTALFEEVRYGGFEATPERTDRARAALSRILDRYEPRGDRKSSTAEEG